MHQPELQKLSEAIRDVPDFPKPGILFKDITPVLGDSKLFATAIRALAATAAEETVDKVVGIDARGFIFGSAISLYTSKPMIFARKPGKLPGELVSKSYNLEYGKNSLSIKKKFLDKYNSFVIVDDLVATGGTVNCVYEILNDLNKEITGLNVVVELEGLGARSKLPFKVSSQVKF